MEDSKVQEYLSREDIVIEGSTATWEMRLEGEIHGTYTGTFRFRCFLTPTQRIAAGREHRELLGSNAALADTHDFNVAFSLTQLKYRILSAPPFWSSTLQANGMSGDIPDENIIDVVLQAAVDAELKYKAQLKKKKVDAIERAKKAAESLLRLRDEDESKNQADDGNA